MGSLKSSCLAERFLRLSKSRQISQPASSQNRACIAEQRLERRHNKQLQRTKQEQLQLSAFVMENALQYKGWEAGGAVQHGNELGSEAKDAKSH